MLDDHLLKLVELGRVTRPVAREQALEKRRFN